MRYNKKRFIYLISPPKIERNFFKDLNEVLKQNKTSFFQLRLKKDSLKKRLIIGRKIQKICKKFKVKFIINDDVYLAKKLSADGCHLGQSDMKIKEELLVLVFQKNKFDYNQKLLNEITNKKFNDNNFLEMGKEKIQTINLNSVRDNKKFDINAVEVLYSLPEKSFTLINDENNNIYLAKVKKFEKQIIDTNKEEFKQYIVKQNSKSKNSLLKSYDTFLNDKYDVSLNQQTIERVKNYFK